MIVDSEVQQKLGITIQDLLSDEAKTKAICEALIKAAQPEACSKIVAEIELLLKSKS